MKNIRPIIASFTLLGFFFYSFSAESQNLFDSDLKSLFVRGDTASQDFKKPMQGSVNEADILFSFGFLFYKKLISSQDSRSCVFSPSCSEFAVEAFKHKGIVKGWVMTFDRLSRCHGFVKPSQYRFDNNNNLFYDPIK